MTLHNKYARYKIQLNYILTQLKDNGKKINWYS